MRPALAVIEIAIGTNNHFTGVKLVIIMVFILTGVNPAEIEFPGKVMYKKYKSKFREQDFFQIQRY